MGGKDERISELHNLCLRDEAEHAICGEVIRQEVGNSKLKMAHSYHVSYPNKRQQAYCIFTFSYESLAVLNLSSLSREEPGLLNYQNGD